MPIPGEPCEHWQATVLLLSSLYVNFNVRVVVLYRLKNRLSADFLNLFQSTSLEHHAKLAEMAMDDMAKLEYLMAKLNIAPGEGVSMEKSIVLYGSETGNAQGLAGVFSQELKRRGIQAKCLAMDDLDFDDLPKYANVYCVVATAGQGEFPNNCKEFWKRLEDKTVPEDYLAQCQFAVFGLGDSGYVFFNEAAKLIDKRLAEIGAKRILGMGLGDDKDDEKFESKWGDWAPDLWNELGTPPPPQELLPATYNLRLDASGALKVTT